MGRPHRALREYVTVDVGCRSVDVALVAYSTSAPLIPKYLSADGALTVT